jgi:hypothetical protein
MEEVSKLQAKRAENIIWNAAQNYGFRPDFKAFDKNGQAELYWNCIIGAARKHYDYKKLEDVFKALDQYEDSDTYEGLLWLGLENALYLKELPTRPVLKELREEYAKALIKQLGYVEDDRFYDAMALAHFKRALGEEPKLSQYDIKLLDELEFSPELDTDEIVKRAKELFQRWFQIVAEGRKKEKRLMPSLFGKKKGTQSNKRYRHFGHGFAEHPDNAYGGTMTGSDIREHELRTKLSVRELREFMESKFGEPIYEESRMMEIERKLCTGNHSSCHLLFTEGEVIKSKIQNGFEALQKEREAVQIEKNRRSFYDNLPQNMTAISKLTAKIQNSVLLHLEPTDVKANAGMLNGSLVWRATNLDDDKVFTKTEQGDKGNLSVDILLDASTSQKTRQELVSCQGYMIAESLSKCGIPCRVMSFCSMTGFTIMRIFRDYEEWRKNEKIFDFVSNGCNRDGLAIRAAHHLINETSYDHKVLIILSDVKPNDVIKIRDREGREVSTYETESGLVDTALEVRRARADGIAVVCVFTGDDEDVPSAKMVYGRDFARIQSLDKFADTVGMLIQNQIKIM